jgi:hypothetical protein
MTGIRCPKCAHENRPDVAFCTACGTRLPITTLCPACGTEFAQDDQFCGLCGGPRERGLTPEQSAPQPPVEAVEPSDEGNTEPSTEASVPAPAEMTVCLETAASEVLEADEATATCSTSEPLQQPSPQDKPASDRPERGGRRRKRAAIASVLLIIVAGAVVAGVVLPSGSSSNRFEEAAQVYALDAESPAEIGSLEKISETPITEGMEEMGASEGRIVEYAGADDHIIVMAFTFPGESSARQAFDVMDGDWIAPDFYEQYYNNGVSFYARRIGDTIYLASGQSIDNVAAVTDELAG